MCHCMQFRDTGVDPRSSCHAMSLARKYYETMVVILTVLSTELYYLARADHINARADSESGPKIPSSPIPPGLGELTPDDGAHMALMTQFPGRMDGTPPSSSSRFPCPKAAEAAWP